MGKKNIILVDDHVIIRNGLKELIEKIGPYSVIKQFDNGEELIGALPQKTMPDLIVLDVNMPRMNGKEVVEKLNEKGIDTPVLILTVNDHEDEIIKFFRLGVRGYLRKDCKAEELGNAMNEIITKGYYHNEFLVHSLKTNAKPKEKNAQELLLEKMTDREKEFLKLVCHEQEYTYEQIADKMNVQHRTVDGYRESLFDKFGIKSKTGLVLFVLRNELYGFL